MLGGPAEQPEKSEPKKDGTVSPLASVAGPSIDRNQIELERRYLVSFDEVIKRYDLGKLPSRKITQSYFPERHIETMALIIAELNDAEIPAGTDFHQARTRFYQSNFGPRYELHVKGRCPGLRADERIEMHAEISKDFYEHLQTMATAGTVEKTRYLVEGKIRNAAGKDVLAFAEIDMFTRAGRPPRKVDPKFVFVEVEVPEPALADSLIKGDHNFELIRGAVDILTLNSGARAIFSNHAFASDGIGRRAKQLARKLLK